MGLNEMDGLTLFGLAAVTAMLVFYALEDRSAWFVLAFAAAVPWRLSKVSCKARGRSVLWKPSGLPSPCTGGASALWINSSSHHALPTPLAVERAIVALRARLITRIASAYVPIVAVISIGRWWCGRVVHGTPAPPLRADGPWLRMIRLISQNCL